MSTPKMLTEAVLAKFAKRDEENKAFKERFASACLKVFGSPSTTLPANVCLMVDNFTNEQILFNWTVDCCLMVQTFLG